MILTRPGRWSGAGWRGGPWSGKPWTTNPWSGVGATAAFSPPNITGLVAWFDADQITGLSDGGAVATWSDVSGNGYDVTQGTAGAQPTYRTAVVNGKPVVRFDGGDSLFRTLTPDETAPFTVFVVWNWTTDGGVNALVFDSRSSGVVRLGVQGGGAGNPRILQGAAATLTAGATTTGVWHITSAIFNGASTVTYDNGTSDIAGDPGTTTIDGLTIGAGAGGSPFTGDIPEVIVYNSALSTADRDDVESYLGSKYAITVA